MMTNQEIQDLVRRLLRREYSGGVKFLELLTEMLGVEANREDPDFPKRLELILEEDMPDVGVLEYGWPMGGGAVRHKQFVYLKLPE